MNLLRLLLLLECCFCKVVEQVYAFPTTPSRSFHRLAVPVVSISGSNGNRFRRLGSTNSPTVNPLVGTAYAPTTPGGACLDNADYSAWINGGYTNFWVDVPTCAETCAQALAPVSCGFLETCDPHPYQTCVANCMAIPTAQRAAAKLVGPGYTANCSDCMGALSQCGANYCKADCVTGGQTGAPCVSCTITNCNPGFIVCSGLNFGRAAEAPENVTLILAIVFGVVGAFLIGTVIFAYFRIKKNRKAKELTIDDLAKLASAQQQYAQQEIMMQSYSQQYSPQMMQMTPQMAPQMKQQQLTQADLINYINQAQQYGVVPPGGGIVVPFPQQQYYDYGQQMAPPPHPPSMAAQQIYQNKISVALTDMEVQAAELIVLFDFVGGRGDELTCKRNEVIFGIEENDNWWLAKTKAGMIGLISSNYVAVKDIRVKDNIGLWE